MYCLLLAASVWRTPFDAVVHHITSYPRLVLALAVQSTSCGLAATHAPAVRLSVHQEASLHCVIFEQVIELVIIVFPLRMNDRDRENIKDEIWNLHH